MNIFEKGRQILCNTFSPPANKYHGLLNQGATCYLNSVLQVLFMTEDFREAVKRHTCENPDTECIDRYLTTLFDDLKGQTVKTNNITNKLGIVRVYEQRDAAEYFEKILSLTSPEASQIFHGHLTNKTKCSQCSTETHTDGAFWHLPLALVDSISKDYSVVDGIEEYFKASDFSGENQMYCDQCDGKSDATLKCVIKHHPEVLMLLLKRFEFDYRYMTYVKNNCTVAVPCTLKVPENQTYELYAVVEHIGDLRSGHYTATIKDDERWYNFNDATVSLLDFQPFQVDNFEKSSSAYLLFYRKTKVHAADTQDTREVYPAGGFPPATSEIYDRCQDAGKMRETEEVEGAAEVGNDTAVAVSIDRYEEKESKDTVSVGSKGVELSPDPCINVGYTRESIPYSHQECNEERNDLRYPHDAQAEKQSNDGKIMMDDEEDKGGNAEAEKRETHLEESVKDQGNDSGKVDDVRQRTPDINHDFKPEVSNRHAIHAHLNKDDEMSDAQRRVMDGKTGEDEQSEKKGKSLTKNLDRDVEHPENEGLVDVRQNKSEDVGGTREVGQDYGLKSVSVDKQADEERTKMDVDTEGKTAVVEGVKITVKITEEEFNDGIQRSSETKYLSIKTVQGTSQDDKSWVENKEGNVKRKSDPKTDAEVSLSESVRNLKLSEASQQEMQKRRLKRVIGNTQEENETNSTIYSSARKRSKVSDIQEHVMEKGECEKTRRWWHYSALLKKHRKGKSKQKQTTGKRNKVSDTQEQAAGMGKKGIVASWKQRREGKSKQKQTTGKRNKVSDTQEHVMEKGECEKTRRWWHYSALLKKHRKGKSKKKQTTGKRNKVSDTQEQAAGMGKKGVAASWKQRREGKSKQKKNTACFPISCINAHKTSDSD